jgi:hypothetical protein
MYKKPFSENLKTFFFLVFSILILIYALYKFSDYFTGPKLKINNPIDGQTISTATFFIDGNIQNLKKIKINGREINIDQSGNFKEELVSHPPLTIITIEAVDRYGKKMEKVLRVVKG